MSFKAPNTVGTTVEVSEIESLALGTLIAGDGSGAPSTLTVGSNGALLQANSTESSGLVWRTSPQMVNAIDWTSGVSASGSEYSILRNNDTVNRLQLNVPSGSMIEFSVNDLAQLLISETEFNFQDNLISADGAVTLGATLNFKTQADSPTATASQGKVYTKTVSGAVELHYMDSSGNEVQMTSAGVIIPSSYNDDAFLVLGTGSDANLGWETADADAHYLNLFLGASRNFIISEDGNIDWGHVSQTNPTLWIHSSDSTDTADYISFAHDQTNAVVDWGNGALSLAGGVTRVLDKLSFTQTDDNEYIDSLADGYLDFSSTTAHRFNMSTADTDVRIEFVGTTNSGLLEWMEDEDYFRFSDTVNLTKAAAGSALDIDITSTAYTTALGAVHLVRSGALTGVDTESIIDLSILPSFTLTEPGAGSVSVYGANIDMTGVAVTAGVGTSVIAALRLVANTDVDAGTNYALFVDSGISAFGGAIVPETNDGSAVGSTTLGWSDLYLASGGNVLVANANAKRTIILSAAGGSPTTTAGCSDPTKVEAGTNDIDYWVLDFDTTTEEHAFWNFQMPDNYDGSTLTAVFVWTNAAGLTTETVVWGIKGFSFADSAAIDQASGSEVTVTDTWLAQGDVHISSASTAITLGGTPTGGEWVQIIVSRKTGSDNLTGDARLMAVKLEYGINAYSD